MCRLANQEFMKTGRSTSVSPRQVVAFQIRFIRVIRGRMFVFRFPRFSFPRFLLSPLNSSTSSKIILGFGSTNK
jgi:hypothetical protein